MEGGGERGRTRASGQERERGGGNRERQRERDRDSKIALLQTHTAFNFLRAQGLRESRGGRPGLPVPNKPFVLFLCVCVDVKLH